jgi:hypothetical protein
MCGDAPPVSSLPPEDNLQKGSAGYNRGMDEKELAKKLEHEGFGHTYVWQDGPNAHYPDHTHAMETAHIILSGEMTLTMSGRTKTCRAGEGPRAAAT